MLAHFSALKWTVQLVKQDPAWSTAFCNSAALVLQNATSPVYTAIFIGILIGSPFILRGNARESRTELWMLQYKWTKDERGMQPLQRQASFPTRDWWGTHGNWFHHKRLDLEMRGNARRFVKGTCKFDRIGTWNKPVVVELGQAVHIERHFVMGSLPERKPRWLSEVRLLPHWETSMAFFIMTSKT